MVRARWLAGTPAPAWWLVAGLMALLAGCGSSGPAAGEAPAGGAPVGSSEGGPPLAGAPAEPVGPPAVLYGLSPTATAYPTFTPMPTATLTPTPRPTLTPAPTATPEPPRVEVPPATPEGGLATPEAPAVPEDGETTPAAAGDGDAVDLPGGVPLDYGQLYNAPVRLLAQSLLPLQRPDVPDYLKRGEWQRLPESAQVVSQRTPYLAWYVVFDMSEAPMDFLMEGWVRWISFYPGLEPLVVHETGVRLAYNESLFYVGLGHEDGGRWRPGKYRVEFLDDRFDSVVDWDFEVR